MTARVAITKEAVREALASVQDPAFDLSITDLGLIKAVEIHGATVEITLELMTPAHPARAEITEAAREAVTALDGVDRVAIDVTWRVTRRKLEHEDIMPGVKNVVAVASGKGGVGKSTTACNLALALAESGAAVGLLDADIYGPSVPHMFGLRGQPDVRDKKIVPMQAHGLVLMSMGFLATDSTPVIWRGPMVHGVVRQFMGDVLWGDLDYLIVDLPPGTGDAQLTLTQSAPLAGAVIVTTPQDVALIDARKGLLMFRQVNAPVLGIIENMSYFECPHCHERTDIFSTAGGERTAHELGVPFLGAIPLVPAVRAAGDGGLPIVAADPQNPVSEAYRRLAGAVAIGLAKQNFLHQAFTVV